MVSRLGVATFQGLVVTVRDPVVLWTIAAATVIGIVGLGIIIFRRIVMQAVERVERTVDSSEERIRAELRAAYLVVGPPLPDPTRGDAETPAGVPSPRHPFRVIAGGAAALTLFIATMSKITRMHPGIATAVVAGVALATLPLVVQPSTERIADIPPAVVAGPTAAPPATETQPPVEPPVTEPLPPPVDEPPEVPSAEAAALPPDGSEIVGQTPEPDTPPAQPTEPAPPVDEPQSPPDEPPTPNPPADTVTTCALELPLRPLAELCLLPG